MKKNYFLKTCKGVLAVSVLAMCGTVAVTAQNNAWKTNLPGYSQQSGFETTMDCSRIEVDDNLIKTDNVRSTSLSLAAWVKVAESYQDVSGSNTLNNYFGETGVMIMGHRQPQVYGYGGVPSFSISFREQNKIALFSRAKIDGGFPNEKSVVSELFDLNFDEWVHLAMTAQLDENQKPHFEMFINGVKATEFTISENDPELPFLPDTHNGQETVFVFGEGIDAQFDNIMIWNKAISEDEVKASMLGYASPAEVDGLVGFYTLDNINEDGTSDNMVEGFDNIRYSKFVITGKINQTNIHLGRPDDASKATKQYLSQEEASERSSDITEERPMPIGGNRFFSDAEGTEEFTGWQSVEGDENFRYAQNTTESPVYRNVYGGSVVPVDFAVFHRGDLNDVTYVAADDILNGLPSEITETSIKAGINYEVALEAGKWASVAFPVSATAAAEGVAVKTYGSDGEWELLEEIPAQFSGAYVMSSEEEKTLDVTSEAGKVLVLRQPSAEYSALFMGEETDLNVMVANPYLVSVDALELCSSVEEKTLYRYDAETESFVKQAETFEVAPLEAFIMIKSTADVPELIKVEEEGTGIDCFQPVYKVNVRGIANTLEVETLQETAVEIYSLNGLKVAEATVEGSRTFALNSGVYLVKTVYGENVQTVKAVVK